MKTVSKFNYLVISLFMMTISQYIHAQDYPRSEDVSTITGIMKASYEVVSGEAGAKRQWQRDQSLHHPRAVYSFSSSKDKENKQIVMTLDEFHQETDDMVLETAFYESEVNKEVQIFGNIAHVWSTYQTRLVKDGPVVRRGINSVQLIKYDNRWWILSWIFDRELENRPIPQTYDWH